MPVELPTISDDNRRKAWLAVGAGAATMALMALLQPGPPFGPLLMLVLVLVLSKVLVNDDGPKDPETRRNLKVIRYLLFLAWCVTAPLPPLLGFETPLFVIPYFVTLAGLQLILLEDLRALRNWSKQGEPNRDEVHLPSSYDDRDPRAR